MSTTRLAVHSEEYAQKLANMPKLSASQKQAHIDKLMNAPDGFKRVGQGMIGPVQIRLRYEGLVRNVLMEDPLDRGPIMPYDVLDELGLAYILHSTDSEVKAQVFEGRQAPVHTFRVAAFPKVRKEDLHRLRVNIVEYAQDESRQAILKKEDYRLMYLLEQAIINWGAAGISPTGGQAAGLASGPSGHTSEKTTVIGNGNPLELQDFYAAAAQVDIDQNEATNVLIHPVDSRDIYTWDFQQTGVEFKNEMMKGKKVTTVGEFTFRKSIMVPQGETFLTAEPEFIGVMPVYYSLDVEENHRVEQFHRGWVMDEMIGMAVLNARGIARIAKADTYAGVDDSTQSGGLSRSDLSNSGLEQ